MRWCVRESCCMYLCVWMEFVWGLVEGWSGLVGEMVKLDNWMW